MRHALPEMIIDQYFWIPRPQLRTSDLDADGKPGTQRSMGYVFYVEFLTERNGPQRRGGACVVCDERKAQHGG